MDGASVYPTSVKPLIKNKTNQSVWNIPPRHLGPCLNCKLCWHKVKRELLLQDYLFCWKGCQNVWVGLPLRATALCCCLPQSTLINGSLWDEPNSLTSWEAKEKRRKEKHFTLTHINMRSKNLVYVSEFLTHRLCVCMHTSVLKCLYVYAYVLYMTPCIY